MNKHPEPIGPSEEQQITLRGPAELADALPYLMGFHPNDSVVMVALHGGRGRFGGRLRLGIPQSAQEWPVVAEQLAECLIKGSERRGARPDAIVVFLCQDPADGETGNQTMERLRPFAQRLRTACGALDVPVLEALCISDNRFWSYVCPDARCCPAEGNPMAMPGTSVMAAAATYAGIQVRGSLREMEARLTPLTRTSDDAQLRALDSAGSAMVPLLFDRERRKEVSGATLKLARRLMDRLGQAPAAAPSLADINDDRLISDEEAASVILGLQDRETRDRAAEWMEGAEADAALRLWRALARRCVAPYEEHAAAPLTLAGWVSWSTGDEPAARVALGLALRLDPHYTFAQLLHEACNQGLDPETLRRCLRGERSTRAARRDRCAERVAGARPARVRPAGRARTRSGSTRPGPAAAGKRRTARPGAQGRRRTGTSR
ncbi:DUF4192 domain-containing protein [Streptomyces sp. NPDC019224]|uniref:DUF4192 domain-containing protein n=1 Tax=Streptomyces sp. NPDC019224 TaxID=3154484 RepID=UPI0033E29CE9